MRALISARSTSLVTRFTFTVKRLVSSDNALGTIVNVGVPLKLGANVKRKYD